MKQIVLLLIVALFVGCGLPTETEIVTVDRPVLLVDTVYKYTGCDEMSYFNKKIKDFDSDTLKVFATYHYSLQGEPKSFYDKTRSRYDTLNAWYRNDVYQTVLAVQFVRDSVTYDTVCYEIKECTDE